MSRSGARQQALPDFATVQGEVERFVERRLQALALHRKREAQFVRLCKESPTKVSPPG